jgi:hypothetical protein
MMKKEYGVFISSSLRAPDARSDVDDGDQEEESKQQRLAAGW